MRTTGLNVCEPSNAQVNYPASMHDYQGSTTLANRALHHSDE